MCRAFGATGAPQLLARSSGGVWRVGDVVLKQAGDPDEAAFVASVSSQIDLIAPPLAAGDGSWLHDGWSASRFVPAHPDPTRWDEVAAVGVELHQALADLGPGWPAALDHRRTPWAIADRVAWGEERAGPAVDGRARGVVEHALELTGAVTGGAVQVIHGDLAGNVLFPAAGSPTVIDLSPYRRPVAFAHAIVVADQIAWHGAPMERVARCIDDGALSPADLLRAVVLRIVAAAEHGSADLVAIELAYYEPLLRAATG